MAITRKPPVLSVCLKETENWNSSSKTVFYKDCSLEGGGGGGKRERERERGEGG